MQDATHCPETDSLGIDVYMRLLMFAPTGKYIHTITHLSYRLWYTCRYTCFADPDCRACFAALRATHGNSTATKAQVIGSPICSAAISKPAMHVIVQNACAVPICTFWKQLCGKSHECSRCLATFGNASGADAARQCRGETTAAAFLLDNLVNSCNGGKSMGACSYWRQRCDDNINCGGCLAAMGDGESSRDAAVDWSTPACQRALQDELAPGLISNIMGRCPDAASCKEEVSRCVTITVTFASGASMVLRHPTLTLAGTTARALF